ncbi:beta-N-acetylhexosaminidase [uncultured Flavobacterium sp.]|uniref:beta-N-acetylhexosaminidase n=1 Tax=uncultured Flavobacterium sp. TaxID=165435 RepID=UPI0025E50192|nr:beta-N-acetylhexosaminidase [uncultured Flavobacterium sp.]
MKKILLHITTILSSIFIHAQLIPAPEQITLQEGQFVLDNSVGIAVKTRNMSEISNLTSYLIDKIESETGVFISSKKENNKNIKLEILNKPNQNLQKEGYILNVTTKEIQIKANNITGLFYGIQSLLQYIIANNTQTPIKLNNLSISDKPNFAWRGMVLDVSRHFFNVSAIKEMLDIMAFYKLNVFHWHLTDNEGWRIEIKKYPKLTSTGAWRTEIPGSVFYQKDSTYNKKLTGNLYKYGGYYSQKQIKEIVDYAKERNITVVPEIDLPGHSGAALTAYPEFSCEKHKQDTPNSTLWNGVVNVNNVNLNYCAGQDESFVFLEDILTEVMSLFPSEYIHIGGDEVDKSYWKRCSACQKRMKDNNLSDEHELQSYFIQRIEKFINSKGKKIIGWDEILEGGLAPNATVMSWRGEQGGIKAAKLKKNVIMSPSDPFYFNRYQGTPENEPFAAAFSINTLEKVYKYNLNSNQLSQEEQQYILGAEFGVWTEFISSVEHLEYIILPRMLAFSENLWSVEKKKNYDDFIERMKNMHFDYWKANGKRFHPKFYTKSIY